MDHEVCSCMATIVGVALIVCLGIVGVSQGFISWQVAVGVMCLASALASIAVISAALSGGK